METTTSKQFSLNLQDISKGFLLAIISALITGLYQYGANLISTGNALAPPTVSDLKNMGYVAIFAGVSYLFKNFLQPSQTVIKAE